jgi:3-oxoacyl-[acyl-carrier-protein] synthase II
MSTLPRVVITGLGAVTPLGIGVPTFWANAVAGQSGARPITRFDASTFPVRFACDVPAFDPHQFMDRKLARRTDLVAQYAVAAANEAIVHAGLTTGTLSDAERARIGVVIGSGQGGMGTFQEQSVVWQTQGAHRMSPFFVPNVIVDAAGAVVAMEHGLRGPNYAVVSACATGNDSIMSAFDAIRAGRADIMLAGGTEAVLTEMGVGGFAAARALSTRNDAPAAASRPFDAARDGFVIGEGAAVLVLESLDSARARGVPILAELLAIGAACDAYHMTAPEPSGRGAQLAMRQALTAAGLTAREVDTINMHATSTRLGDEVECRAVRSVFGDDADRVVVTSTKSMTGHMLGAAGAAEAVLSVLALVHQTVPPTINLSQQDPECALRVAANVALPMPIEVAMSNAFGFGGHNSSVLLRRAEAA